MSIFVVKRLRKAASELLLAGESNDIASFIRDRYGILVNPEADIECLRMLKDSLNYVSPELVKECGIKGLDFEDLGPSKEYYPNHGVYRDNGTLVLNIQLLDDPLLIAEADSGRAMNKFDQTLYHEMGHGFDHEHRVSDKEDGDLSLQKEWMGISKWSKEPKPGLHRIRIKDKGTPELVGEYYFSPDAKFTRFYGKRNPYDDWADCFSYYVAGLRSFLPEDKLKYFDKRIKKFSPEDKKK